MRESALKRGVYCFLALSVFACASERNLAASAPPPPPPEAVDYLTFARAGDSSPELEICSEMWALIELERLINSQLRPGKNLCPPDAVCDEGLARNELKRAYLEANERKGEIWRRLKDADQICHQASVE